MENTANYIRPEELLAKVIAENIELKNDIKMLEDELEEEAKYKSIIRNYQQYYNGNEVPTIENNTNNVEIYIDWLESNSNEVQAYADAFAQYL